MILTDNLNLEFVSELELWIFKTTVPLPRLAGHRQAIVKSVRFHLVTQGIGAVRP